MQQNDTRNKKVIEQESERMSHDPATEGSARGRENPRERYENATKRHEEQECKRTMGEYGRTTN